MNPQPPTFSFKFSFDLAELVWLEGYGNYTTLHLANGQKVLSCRNLKQFEAWLCQHADFVRIHKSFVVNRAFVLAFQRADRAWFVELLGGRQLPVARGRVGVVRK